MSTHPFAASCNGALRELPESLAGRKASEPDSAPRLTVWRGALGPATPESSEARLRAILAASPNCICVVGRDGWLTDINPAGLEILGAGSMADLAASPFVTHVSPEHREAFDLCVEALWRGEKAYAEFETTGGSGPPRWLEMHAVPLPSPDGENTSFLGILRDNTARRDLNKQFIQAQKMEVVGHLAGGIAHDFNNMLGIILGYTEIIMCGMPKGSPERDHAEAVFHTAERAATLTRQLLIFSRKETPRPQPVDLSEMIVKIDPMLRRLIGEKIKLITLPEPGMHTVQADAGQIEQVVMNLTVNARDAMPHGGTITVETTNLSIEPSDPRHPTIPAGHYALLTVSDTGAGMSDDVKAKIFDAFFTTKPAGQGTGLGLATCQSIVQNWRGHIEVESRLGAGSSFRIYLPCLPSSAKAGKTSQRLGPPPRGTETILVVEDEPGLLALTEIVLQRQGYTVLKASNGREGLGIMHEGPKIDLVITDMVMPEMGGRIMAQWLRALRPGIKILFTSGYTDCSGEDAIDPAMDFIEKPYSPAAMLRKVREVIERGAPQPGTESRKSPKP